ncbi:MAG TPA: hypothetical protein EYQ50_07820 [Verrucomicrobiales bacterium]|nr:hypothetical protein [Verrucomicrobiales bacterium]
MSGIRKTANHLLVKARWPLHAGLLMSWTPLMTLESYFGPMMISIWIPGGRWEKRISLVLFFNCCLKRATH